MSEMNITYLLGAGASFKAIPLSKSFAESMQNWLDTSGKDLPDIVTNHLGFQRLSENIKRIHAETQKATSIDSYAKILYLRQDNTSLQQLHELKATISTWLLIRQRGGKIDNRYTHFLAGISNPIGNGNIQLNSRINILSWNYDLQMELALLYGVGVKDQNVISVLNAPPPDRGQKIVIKNDQFFLARINGFAGAHLLGNKHDKDTGKYARMFNLITDKDLMKSMHNIIELYSRYLAHNDLIPAIDFAWEENSMWNQYLKMDVLSALRNTNHLVIIGYSFPAFNNDIDKEILSHLRIRKLTIQNPEAGSIRTRIEAIAENWHWNMIKTREVTNCDDFEIITQ